VVAGNSEEATKNFSRVSGKIFFGPGESVFGTKVERGPTRDRVEGFIRSEGSGRESRPQHSACEFFCGFGKEYPAAPAVTNQQESSAFSRTFVKESVSDRSPRVTGRFVVGIQNREPNGGSFGFTQERGPSFGPGSPYGRFRKDQDQCGRSNAPGSPSRSCRGSPLHVSLSENVAKERVAFSPHQKISVGEIHQTNPGSARVARKNSRDVEAPSEEAIFPPFGKNDSRTEVVGCGRKTASVPPNCLFASETQECGNEFGVLSQPAGCRVGFGNSNGDEFVVTNQEQKNRVSHPKENQGEKTLKENQVDDLKENHRNREQNSKENQQKGHSVLTYFVNL
jgi:hypothetical protein